MLNGTKNLVGNVVQTYNVNTENPNIKKNKKS